MHGRGLQIHPALSKLALVLVSAVLAACGPVIVTPPSATPTPNLEASFAGLFLGSNGSSLSVLATSGRWTVSIVSATTLSEMTSGQPSDLQAGDCLLIGVAVDSGTASIYRIEDQKPEPLSCELTSFDPNFPVSAGLTGTLSTASNTSITFNQTGGQVTLPLSPTAYIHLSSPIKTGDLNRGDCVLIDGRQTSQMSVAAQTVIHLADNPPICRTVTPSPLPGP